ncbi:hypothetical protein BB559_006910 [Furculomyces boomerangus]|uniref:Protein HGH1 homolog n=2 Tax=Harpellales TaxID=61421 RepID=A0A2T9XY02_9FUNG|nr:hypothetical protein BB559_007286 [Furculomyces boomerangus]PVU85636.1 hypothetical protein BB559_006910 [Furculomyces boomerangus]PVZ97616.1 hypothetical protein BB558_006412 [Smittium angustum]
MEQLQELIGFLSSEREDVRGYAVNYVAGFTKPGSEYYNFFVEKASSIVPVLLDQREKNALEAHDAVKILINLTSDERPRSEFRDPKILKLIVEKITDVSNIIADLYCMLLSNICKDKAVSDALVTLKIAKQPEIINSDLALDQLTQLFLMGVGENRLNKKANFDFLSSVFAELTIDKPGREYFINPDSDGKVPLTKVMVFSEYPELIRRGGVISVLKNVCFSINLHKELLSEDHINILPYILLPLCGPDDYDEEDMDGMPEEVQLLPPEKQRETDHQLRLTLVEALVLLATHRESREHLRKKKVYPIIRQLHLSDNDEQTSEAIDKLVQLLMRYEENDERANENINNTPKIRNMDEDFEEI